MAQDLRRYLAGLPVHATPPGRVYLIRKFIARHQAITAMAALLTIAVVGGLAALSYGMREARLGRLEAENAFREEAIERARAQAMSDFLLGNMLTAIDPDLYQGEDRSLQEILRATAEEAGLVAGETAGGAAAGAGADRPVAAGDRRFVRCRGDADARGGSISGAARRVRRGNY